MADPYVQLRLQSERRMKRRIAEAEQRIADAQKELEAAQEERAQAEQEHEANLQRILDLERNLPEGISEPEVKPRNLKPPKRGIPDLICSVLPGKNESFTLNDVYQWLTKSYPDRKFNRLSVRTFLHRLMTEGTIIRLQKGGGDRRATFVISGSDVDLGPFGDLTTIEIAELVIGDLGQPVKTEDIVTEMLARGFKPTGTRSELKHSLASTMRKNARFHEGRKGWTVDPKKEKGSSVPGGADEPS